MSKKVIIIWSISIVIFALIGLFGFLNRGLLLSDDNNETYIPKSESNIKKCIAKNNNITTTYFFTMANNENISKTIITYTNKNNSLNEYETISNFNSKSKTGITTNITGTKEDIQFSINVDHSILDYNEIVNDINSLKNVGIYLDNTNNYLSYSSNIKNNLVNYNIVCE